MAEQKTRGLAQMVERTVRDREASSSSLLSPTNYFYLQTY